MTEKPSRSLVKAISWRITGTIDTVVISYVITGHARWAFTIGFIELFTKITLYFVHERIWDLLAFGRVPASEDFAI